MDYAGAIGISMIIVLIIGILVALVGLFVLNVAEKSRSLISGLVILWAGGSFIFLALIGWIVAIWLGYAQAAA